MCGLKDWPQPPEEPRGKAWFDVTVTMRIRTICDPDEVCEEDIFDDVMDAVKALDYEIDDFDHYEDLDPGDFYDC
ncbi:hypothetical protein [Corynebacterium renale]|uniref:hypothetical protein n=1 Tax=Corynebacterium renale TaxID=1724 RepID=UPI000DFFFC1D|nr:hypothetical protein [Corynebacterium renale]STC97682.1 Uncharacterised protein [Corynebacterium renale]STD70272.1 Uncharacterised protein [Corynebacterium renale]